MKQPLKNIFSMTLLVFYLTGICGIHFIKHSCFSCNHSDLHITLSADNFAAESEHCCCESHDHSRESHFESTSNTSQICCDYDFVFLKTNPTTTISKNSKAPNILELNIFVTDNFKFLSFLTPVIPSLEYIDSYPDSSDKIMQDFLCCFLC